MWLLHTYYTVLYRVEKKWGKWGVTYYGTDFRVSFIDINTLKIGVCIFLNHAHNYNLWFSCPPLTHRVFDEVLFFVRLACLTTNCTTPGLPLSYLAAKKKVCAWALEQEEDDTGFPTGKEFDFDIFFFSNKTSLPVAAPPHSSPWFKAWKAHLCVSPITFPYSLIILFAWSQATDRIYQSSSTDFRIEEKRISVPKLVGFRLIIKRLTIVNLKLLHIYIKQSFRHVCKMETCFKIQFILL